MTDEQAKNRERLKDLFRELFRVEQAELNFGIPRIMNAKREQVEDFIDGGFLDAVEEGLGQLELETRERLAEELEQARAKVIEHLGPEVLDASGEVKQYHGANVVKDYREAKQRYEEAELPEETETKVLSDLYRLFKRYYRDGDFLTERRVSSLDHKYYMPYDGDEVFLHWANRGQYYVKTSERFTDYSFDVNDYKVWLRLEEADEPQGNVKANDRYFVLRRVEDEGPVTYCKETGTLTVRFAYRSMEDEEKARYLSVYNETTGSKKKRLDRSAICVALEAMILQHLDGLSIPELKALLATPASGDDHSRLQKHLNRYTAPYTMDYFIHKNLGKFLKRELDFYLKNEVLKVGDFIDDVSGKSYDRALARARVVRDIGREVIDSLAHIEDFQRRLFEKRKFVLQTDYCVTLDQVPENLYPRVLENESQLEEWQWLYRPEDWEDALLWKGAFDEAFLQSHPHLMVDTAYFDEQFKAELLESFDDLEEKIDGVLIHGENFQALNLLMARYGGLAKCVYIDPPYNSKTSEILYKNTYKHSSWLALMENRLVISRELCTEDGSHVIAIDENEQERLGLLLDELFADHERVCVAVRHNKKGIQGDFFSYNHDYAYFCLPPALGETNEVEIPEEKWNYSNLRKWGSESRRNTVKNCFYPILVKDNEIVGFGDVCSDDYHPEGANVEREDGIIEVYPIDRTGVERKWRYARDSVPDILDALRVHVTNKGLFLSTEKGTIC